MDEWENKSPANAEVSDTPAETSAAADAEMTADAGEAVVTQKPQSTMLETVYDLMDNLIVALLVVAVIFTFFFRVIAVHGASMNDTLQDQDRLLLQTAFYTPQRGDIVVIYEEDNPDKPLIKRVIAVGGDSLRLDVQNNAVYLKEAGTDSWTLLDESEYVHYPLAWGIYWSESNEVTVPEGHVFVMGDHRNNSRDSRYESVGFVPADDVIGHAFFRIQPISEMGTV